MGGKRMLLDMWFGQTAYQIFTFEIHPAKEARKSQVLVRKTPRLFRKEIDRGLQCGLSGNLALFLATKQRWT